MRDSLSTDPAQSGALDATRLPASGGNGVGAPRTARDHLIEVVALEVAAGTKLSDLARRHGYTYGGMSNLVQSDAVQERVAHYRAQIDNQRVLAGRKVLLHLTDLTDAELAVALPELPDDAPAELKLAAYSSRPSQTARHYLMDKVWPTVQRTESVTEVVAGGEAQEVLVEFRDLMKRMRAEREVRTVNILDSKHVYEGEAALPNPLQMAGQK